MKIYSIVVIDDKTQRRIAFGIALEEVWDGFDYYPLEHIDELLTLPNAIIDQTPDIIFVNLDAYFCNGLRCIAKLKNVDLLKNVPIVVYSKVEIDKNEAESAGAAFYFQMPESISLLAKLISPMLTGNTW